MTNSLPPALTPERWSEVFAQIERAPIVLGRGHQVVACIECNEDGGEDFHAAAAIALYDQPFGFRRIHADAIRSLINAEVERGLDIETKGTCRMASEALSRILALLPPE